METSGFALEGRVRERAATGYTVRREGAERVPHGPMCGMAPAGQLYTSVMDLARFLSLQFREGPAGGAQILGSASLREMHAPVYMAPDWASGVAIGWHLRRTADQVTIGHSGSLAGFTASVVAVPKLKLGIAVCCSAQFTVSEWGPETGARAALEALIPALLRVQARAKPAEAPDAHPEWARYTGVYREAYFADVEVRLTAGRLWLARPFGKPAEVSALDHVEGHAFRKADGPSVAEPVVFDVDKEGRVTGMRMPGAAFRRLLDG